MNNKFIQFDIIFLNKILPMLTNSMSKIIKGQYQDQNGNVFVYTLFIYVYVLTNITF